MAEGLPVVIIQRYAQMFGYAVEMDWRIGRTANRGVNHNRIFKCFPGHNGVGAQILTHHINDTQSSFVADLTPFTVWRGNGGGTG